MFNKGEAMVKKYNWVEIERFDLTELTISLEKTQKKYRVVDRRSFGTFYNYFKTQVRARKLFNQLVKEQKEEG